MKINNHENCRCKCKTFALIFLNNGEPFISMTGPQEVLKIKEIIGIPEHETLIQEIEDQKPQEYQDFEKVTIKGCEVFYGLPPGAGNSKSEFEKSLTEIPFLNTLGVEPIYLREAGTDLLIFNNLSIGIDINVDVCLEIPSRNRLLFSTKIETPKNPNANWASQYCNILIGGRVWQGVSLSSKELNPLKMLQSLIRALV